ncbi:MAG: V-type ATP synthase subunit C [Clostridia bacterium]|nr:V-type ATP synthase subunit C [Clostridia bacterium]
MADTKYTYAVARIRALELALFSASSIEQLVACKDYKQCLQFLTEKGWGGADTPLDGDAILTRESQKTWEMIRELHVDMDAFDVLSYQKLFHNLKAAVKEICTSEVNAHIFFEDCEIGSKEMLRIISQRDYQALPVYMQEAAKEAYETLLRTRDGQLCDVIVDKAALEAISAAGKSSKVEIIKNYAESTVAIADIKIAYRCAKTGKSMDFMRRSLAKCGTLNLELLMKAATSGVDAVSDYLSQAGYQEAAEAMKESNSAFERWCDNKMVQTIQPQKYNPFTIGPLIAYVLARENEIKTVRIILTCKQNGLSDDSIRERVREMYV